MLNQFLSIEHSKNEKSIKRIENRKINKTNKNPQINETYETNVFSCQDFPYLTFFHEEPSSIYPKQVSNVHENSK